MAIPIKLYQYTIQNNSSSEGGFHIIRAKWNNRVDAYRFDKIVAHVWQSDQESKNGIEMMRAHFESFNPDVKS